MITVHKENYLFENYRLHLSNYCICWKKIVFYEMPIAH